MYYRKNGQIIRPGLPDQHKVKMAFRENFEPKGNGNSFPVWLIILIVLIVVVIAICLIWWVITRKPKSRTPQQFGFKFY